MNPKNRRLSLVTTPPPPITDRQQVVRRLKRIPKPVVMLQCPRCAGREVIETKTGVLLKNGKATGGTKQWLCAACHLRGDRVVVMI